MIITNLEIGGQVIPHLTAAEGCYLTDGQSKTTEVYLGIYDNVENWTEIEGVIEDGNE